MPPHAAQITADRLASIDAKGILNFTPERIHVPEKMQLLNIDLSVELQALIYLIRNQK